MQLVKNWYEILREEIEKPYIAELKRFVEEERQRATIYPPDHLVFSTFGHTPFADVKVVIMGQDPYHGPGQAHGMSFSVPPGVPAPPSLLNIFKELNTDLGIPIPKTGCLTSWAKQGVLLLNATLTVRAGEPRSHYGHGWERFTDAVIQKLAEREDPMVFLLWGRSAKEKCAALQGHPRHALLTSAHPSPLSAHNGFFGCRHFSHANALLTQWGKSPINWSLQPSSSAIPTAH